MLGEAMEGPLRGKEIEQIPSVMTDWETWRTEHPGSTVLWMGRTSTEYQRQFYRNPELFVLGIADGGRPKSWGFDAMMRNPVMNDDKNGQAVLVAFDRRSFTARLYARQLDGVVLTFQNADGRLVDEQTGTTWDPTTGRGAAGRFAGRYLRALPAIVSYKRAWLNFHPKSQVVSANRGPASLQRQR